MDEILQRPAVRRVRAALDAAGVRGEVVALSDSTRTALDAAAALGADVGQIAASLVFRLPDGAALLVITSGRHRVDVDLVASALGVETIGRADADFVKAHSGFSIGGVSPVGWVGAVAPRVVIDQALSQYGVIWAAAGHPHAVYPTTFDELRDASGATALVVSAS